MTQYNASDFKLFSATRIYRKVHAIRLLDDLLTRLYILGLAFTVVVCRVTAILPICPDRPTDSRA